VSNKGILERSRVDDPEHVSGSIKGSIEGGKEGSLFSIGGVYIQGYLFVIGSLDQFDHGGEMASFLGGEENGDLLVIGIQVPAGDGSGSLTDSSRISSMGVTCSPTWTLASRGMATLAVFLT
jgi:hypothetical protein